MTVIYPGEPFASLHTSIRGAGQPVVLLHSGGMSGRQGSAFADAGPQLACNAPALIVSGDRSPAAARRVAVQLTAALPNATSQVIAGAGHMGPTTHADFVNQAIASHVLC